jgi:hypothetical protein
MHKDASPRELYSSGREPRTLRDFLSIPYTLESKAVENDAGIWMRRVSYPELPDCSAEAVMVEDAIRQLERRRVQTIVRMLREGRDPPCPRGPILGCDPEWLAADVGLGNAITDLLDRPSAEIRAMPDPFALRRNTQDFAEGKG